MSNTIDDDKNDDDNFKNHITEDDREHDDESIDLNSEITYN